MEDLPTLEHFLETLKLSSLLELFKGNNITTVIPLMDLSDDELKNIGVEKPGYRKRMINELKTLRKRLDPTGKSILSPITESNGCIFVPGKLVSTEGDKPPPAGGVTILGPEEEVDVDDGKQRVLNEEDEELPPVPPKKNIKPAPPVPHPRNSHSSKGTMEQQPLQLAGEQPLADKCAQADSTNARNLQVNPPVIPPRTDLEEKSVDHELKIVQSDVSRSKSLPVKRPAPAPPIKGASLKEKTPAGNSLSANKLDESISGEQDSSHPIENNNDVDSSKYPTGMRGTSLSVVKNKEFLGKIDSLIQSPRKPAPPPPKIASSQLSTGDDQDSSSESDAETQESTDVNEPPLQRSSAPIVQVDNGQHPPLVNRMSRVDVSTKEGFLEKRGGQNNTKGFKKRWLVFDGKDLRYYKPSDKDARSDCLQTVPLHRMSNVKSDSSSRRPQFSLETPNRTYIFASDDHNEILLWTNILAKAIFLKDQNPPVLEASSVGGIMADPDKEGWLRKQGHNVSKDWKARYAVVKDGKVAYYSSYEDYTQDAQLNCLNMALSKVLPDPNRFRITIKTAQQKDFVFEANDEASYGSWVTAFETSIQFALGDPAVLKALQKNPANKFCADCGKRNPVWASVNLLVVVCDQCIGFHRKLGAQISKARSILMDVKVWSSSLIQLMQSVGNKEANSFWEYKLPDDDKIGPDSSSGERYDFIVSKYKDKKYINFSQFYGQAAMLGEALRRNVITNNVITTLQLISCGASVYYVREGSEDLRTPFELATAANQELQMELLRQFNGDLTAEERESKRKEDKVRAKNEYEEPAVAPQQSAWEKQGVLLKRGPKNSEPWRKRVFYLQKRSLYYQADKERELIDLKEVIEIQLGVNDNDPSTINIVLPNRTFYLKGESVSEAESWYWAIKNKQVFGVDIRNQDVNSKSIPLLVAKCIDFVECYALEEEGIYRRNGSVATIKNLRRMFDQDAPGVRLTIEDYPNVHDVCGLLKLYLREGLLEPLMTQKLYKDFIANAAQTDHNSRLTTLYELIRKLPEVNLCTLTRLVLHLNKVIRKSDENLMSKENVNRIFAPITLNKGNSTDERVLNKEYKIFDDILTYDTYFFDIDHSEEARKEMEIEKAKKVMSDAMNQQSKISDGHIDEIQISVSVEGIQKSCMVKVNSKTTASDVCWYIIKFLSLSFDGNWSLFEKIETAGLERPLHTKDLVFPIVMESGKWEGSSWMLVLKNNYVAEMTAPYQDNKLSMSGKIYWRKNDGGWKEHFLKIKTGNLIISLKEHGSEIEQLALHQWNFYIGADEKGRKKSSKRYGITLVNGNEKRYISTEDEKYLYRWISAILQIKHPSGIWTNLRDAERRMTRITEDLVPIDNRKSVFLGRQSTYRRQEGSSGHIQRELQIKRRSLKKVR